MNHLAVIATTRKQLQRDNVLHCRAPRPALHAPPAVPQHGRRSVGQLGNNGRLCAHKPLRATL